MHRLRFSSSFFIIHEKPYSVWSLYCNGYIRSHSRFVLFRVFCCLALWEWEAENCFPLILQLLQLIAVERKWKKKIFVSFTYSIEMKLAVCFPTTRFCPLPLPFNCSFTSPVSHFMVVFLYFLLLLFINIFFFFLFSMFSVRFISPSFRIFFFALFHSKRFIATDLSIAIVSLCKFTPIMWFTYM